MLHLPEDVLWSVCKLLGWRECVIVRGACSKLRNIMDSVVAVSKVRGKRVVERSPRTVRFKGGMARLTNYSLNDENGVVFEEGVLLYGKQMIVTSVAVSVSAHWFIVQPSGGVSVVKVVGVKEEWEEGEEEEEDEEDEARQLKVVATTRRADVFIDMTPRLGPRLSLLAVHALTDEGVLLLLQYNVVAGRVSAREVARGVRAIGMHFVLFNDGRLQEWQWRQGLVDVKLGVLWLGYAAYPKSEMGMPRVWESADLKTVSAVRQECDGRVFLSHVAARRLRLWHHAWA